MKKNTLINIGLTLLSALLLILSTVGFGFSFFVFVGFIPILYAVRRGGLHPLISGWILGFCYWIVGLSWMTTLFSYFGGAPLPAAFGLLLGVAISGGFFFFAPFAYIAAKKSNPLLIALVFIILEIAKSELFFAGVPWLNLAQSQYKNIVTIQFVSVFGEFGLSFVIMVINVLIFQILMGEKVRKNSIALAVAVVIMLAPGIYRNFAPIKIDNYANVKIIQTGLKQEDKWDNGKIYSMVNDINKTLMSVDRSQFDLIVLPESAYPARILDTPFIIDVISNISFDTAIIAGSDRIEKDAGGNRVNYNSMLFFADGLDVSIYDKMHLTPFGEYFPFENVLAPMKEFFFGPGAMFTPGTESVVFSYKDIKIAPLICFEGAFSKLVQKPVSMGANLIAIISNDSWFGQNMGRVQHLSVDTMRSVEYSRAAVRSTQDGISAVILPNGEIPVQVTQQIPAQIDYKVPLVNIRTLYSYIGNYWIFAMMIVILVMERRRKTLK